MKLNLEDPKIIVSARKMHLCFVTDIEVKRVLQKDVNKFKQEVYHRDY